MSLLHWIKARHNLPLRERAILKLSGFNVKCANPLHEFQDSLRNRIALEPPIHSDATCDRCEKLRNDPDDYKLISGLRYWCLDCETTQADVCSTCVVVPGQGIDHDPAHRLVQVQPTACSVCEDVERLEVKPADMHRGPYKEFLVKGGTFKEVAETRSCGFCTFLWRLLAQSPPEGLKWPPDDDKEVQIRIRKQWRDWLNISVVSDLATEEEFEMRGEKYVRRGQNAADMEKEMLVGPSVAWSHEMPVSEITSEEEDRRTWQVGVCKVLPSSGSSEALQLAKSWLDNCCKRHSKCAGTPPHILPSRVLVLQGQDFSRVYLKETMGIEGSYAALSYCWGPGRPGLITIKDNYRDHQNFGIPINGLPETIRDAVHAARTLGLDYLWVDRLCIVQDSVEDWAHEAALMCAVYSGATLTLSADGSNSATQGLFQSNQTLSALDYKTYYDPGADDLVYIKRPSHASLSGRASDMTQPIDQRGWTMQERLMSPRVLHFTSEEMVWECNTLTECECRRESAMSTRELAPSGITTREGLYEHWRHIVREYAKRSLAYETDKMPALRGLVEKFQRVMQDLVGKDTDIKDEYLAGLWRNDLVEGLAWKPPTPGDLEGFLKATNHRRILNIGVDRDVDSEAWEKILAHRNRLEDWHQSGGYVAPTWSWAHLRGPMSYLYCRPLTPFIPYVNVVEANVVPVNANEPTGQVSSGFVTLEGRLVHGLRLSITQGIEVVVLLLGTRNFVPEKGGYGTVGGLSNPVKMSWNMPAERGIAEASEEDTGVAAGSPACELPGELVEAFVEDTEYPRFTTFLVLKESDLEKGKYERLGCFDVWGRNDVGVAKALFSSSVNETVTII
ncbi:heterokaryon incompatibility protein-domain-containing protein [Colletotrichum acutatum]|uniref:Heterokaryon incompatibility protein-domain-containing protein n=1 Tax=Glomerella acutata TaxID=27357 RepID=A0AAD8UHF4_GLOAC|nr:heterokaryon incompatibility protein-domain-containing protein [Colletotrichum acutatum]KAK1716825.1 heterokaryon incompatibility protein-domain-containing protein [Colletotrichum acutatum]